MKVSLETKCANVSIFRFCMKVSLETKCAGFHLQAVYGWSVSICAREIELLMAKLCWFSLYQWGAEKASLVRL